MNAVNITLPAVPPSMNTNKIRSHWRGFHTAKKRWQADIEIGLIAARIPRPISADGPVQAHAILRFPVRRRRDSENFRPLLSKALGDALTNGGWLGDDTDADWQFHVRISPELGSPQTRIELSWGVPVERLAA